MAPPVSQKKKLGVRALCTAEMRDWINACARTKTCSLKGFGLDAIKCMDLRREMHASRGSKAIENDIKAENYHYSPCSLPLNFVCLDWISEEKVPHL